MEEEIIRKIKSVLGGKNYSEQDIVYFLVESYKLLEQENQKNKFKSIIFYRNWVCHNRLCGEPKKIFQKVLDLVEEQNKSSDKQFWVDPISEEIINSYREYSFPKLESEIKEFSKKFLDGTDFDWEKFRIQTYNVITDTPLLIENRGREVFRFECKKIPPPRITFNELEIKVFVGENYFSFSLDDLSLKDSDRDTSVERP